MGLFNSEVELRNAVKTINSLINIIACCGGSVCMVQADNPNFSVKLDRSIDIVWWGEIGGNDGKID